jgi:hypothetical protein
MVVFITSPQVMSFAEKQWQQWAGGTQLETWTGFNETEVMPLSTGYLGTKGKGGLSLLDVICLGTCLSALVLLSRPDRGQDKTSDSLLPHLIQFSFHCGCYTAQKSYDMLGIWETNSKTSTVPTPNMGY